FSMHPSSRFKVIGVCSLLVLFSASLAALAAPKMVRAASTMGLEPARPSMSSTSSALSCGPWQFVSSPNVGTGDNRLEGVAAVSAKDVWAVGAGPGGTLTEHWNGTQWSIVPSPNPSSGSGIFYAVTAISSNNIWAVGLSFLNNGNEQTLIEHWNGSKWSLASFPRVNSDYRFYAVSATSASDVWAVGLDGSANLPAPIEHWNGSKWSIVPNPALAGSRGLIGVASLT